MLMSDILENGNKIYKTDMENIFGVITRPSIKFLRIPTRVTGKKGNVQVLVLSSTRMDADLRATSLKI